MCQESQVPSEVDPRAVVKGDGLSSLRSVLSGRYSRARGRGLVGLLARVYFAGLRLSSERGNVIAASSYSRA